MGLARAPLLSITPTQIVLVVRGAPGPGRCGWAKVEGPDLHRGQRGVMTVPATLTPVLPWR